MINRRAWWVGLGVIVAAAIMAFFLHAFIQRGKSMLSNSIDVLLSQELRVRHTVHKLMPNDSLTDLGGEWLVSVKDGAKLTDALEAKFQVAGEEDFEAFKDRLKATGLISEEPADYKLYRAELVLGKGTICDSAPCSIYVMYSVAHENIYVGIYKD